LRTLRERLSSSFSIKGDFEALEKALAALPDSEPIDLILLTGEGGCSAASIQKFRRSARRIFREVVSQQEADEALEAGIDGLVAKGNEAGGRVGSESSLVLLQRLCGKVKVPVWAWGGIGPHGAAACHAIGASGIVLQDQLALTDECVIPEPLRSRIAAMDGTETICLGDSVGRRFRVHRQEGADLIRDLQQFEMSGPEPNAFAKRLRAALDRTEGSMLFPVGQDIAFASWLAARHRNVAGIVRAYRSQLADNLRLAAAGPAIVEDSAFAKAHGLRYPIVQGPMTRVSDVAGFADSVSRGGALPFLALALLREAECQRLLEQTAALIGDRPWGVGILAFVPQDLRAEQLKVVLKIRPRFAVLAGGRPDQASALENAGVRTYIHTPSAQLLDMFLRQGTRRFVFEGRECGGHVGPLSSFVLWESALQVLLDFQRKNNSKETIDILFAGGIHDGRSAAMVSAFAASAAAANIRIGVLMGTAYLFTREAVGTGAIVPLFQSEAVECADTVLLDTGGGHAIRCAPSAYPEEFKVIQRKLREEGLPTEEMRERLEDVNVGRLRIATKGVVRTAANNGEPSRLVEVPVERQKADGMYMIGQVAALRRSVCSIEELHREVCQGSTILAAAEASREASANSAKFTEPIAIVGMAVNLPGASELTQYWANILRRQDSIEEVPADRWPSDVFFNTDNKQPDRTMSKWGGFMPSVRFDPMTFGIPPTSLASIEPVHLITLEVTRKALADAGYDKRPFAKENTAVILGLGGGTWDLGQAYQTRCLVELYLDRHAGIDPAVKKQILDHLHATLPELTEDSFPGILGNVAAGRVANRFDLGGPNFTVDAACASTLAALDTAIQELRQGTSDVALVGGAEAGQNIFGYLLFSKTGALSPRGRCRPFDASSDGIATSDGVAMVVLKRLSDAEREGDRIYAVIRSIGAASDGREKSLTAPAVRGQARAMRRAYAPLEFSPTAIELVEAHGTGTAVGDKTELETLRTVLTQEGAPAQTCALGSVKSQIGHTKGTAGLASLIKTGMALHNRVLPPTIFDTPAAVLQDRSNPLYLNTKSRPWFHTPDSPRRAAVSAFGFGGTNFHTVLEEYGTHASATWDRPAELFVFRAATRTDLARELTTLDDRLAGAANCPLTELADSLRREVSKRRGNCRLAIVAKDLKGLRAQLSIAAGRLNRNEHFAPTEPITFSDSAVTGSVAFLFPGQGSQYLNMLDELALCFPLAREVFERADNALGDVLPKRLTQIVFPPPAYSPAEEAEQTKTLNQTWFAQPALGASEYAVFSLLESMDIAPDFVAGHSYGEYVALCAAGVLPFSELIRLSEQRGRAVQETQGTESVLMYAVQADFATAAKHAESTGVSVAGANAPDQTIVGGERGAMETFLARLDTAKIRYQKLAMSAGFHIPEARPAADRFAPALASVSLDPPTLPVFSNLHAAPYPADAQEMRTILVNQLTQPLRFREEIEAMYAAGVRVFIEVGPGQVLSGLVQRILGDKPAVVLATNKKASDSSLADFLRVVGWFYTAGKPVRLEKLFSECCRQPRELAELLKGEEPPKPAEWIVTGGSAGPRAAKPKPVALAAAAATTASPTVSPKSVANTVVTAPAPTPSAAPKSNGVHASAPKAPAKPAQAPLASPPPAPVREAPAAKTSTKAPVAKAPAVPVMNGKANGNGNGNGHLADVMTSFQATMQQFLDYQMESNRQRQELMSRFLDTQRAMVEVFAGNGASHSPAVAHTVQTFSIPAPLPIASLPAREHTPREVAAPIALPSPAMQPEPMPEVAFAPAPAAPPQPGPQPAPAAEPTGPSLHDTLLELISKRTGYPTEMLELDQNLEADLGIDSIKRAEIFGALLENLGFSQSDQEREEYFMAISKLRTVREVLAWLEEQNGKKQTAASPAAASSTILEETESASHEPELRRFLVRAVPEPLNGATRLPRADEVVLLTEDHSGRASEAAAAMAGVGVKVALVRHGSGCRMVSPGIYEADLTSREAVAKVREWVQQQFGTVTTVCHFLPLDCGGADGPNCLEVKSLFMLSAIFGPDLREKEGTLLSLTGMGGQYGVGGDFQGFRPGPAAIPIFLKCLAYEWPEIFVKSVDVDPNRDGDYILSQVVAELSSTDPKIEVGYTEAGRFVLKTYESPLNKNGQRPPLDSNSIILVTGGARGITAAITRNLAGRFRPTFILAGRSEVPEKEGPETLGIEGAAELKKAIVERRKRRNQLVTPQTVESEYRALLRGREVQANLDQLTALGARCEYHSIDVRDSEAFEALIHRLYERHGRIDGVIHGAGIVEDQMFASKSPESFQRVFDTKVQPALVLARTLRPQSLRFLFFLSSLAARYGYAGGGDYSSANEVLNRLARRLDKEWDARVVAIGWGPWAGIGIASHYPEALLKERGLVYHSVDTGVRSFVDELLYGAKGEPEAFHYIPGDKAFPE
jgi:malonyl CoA-acyl carrier protein transacylase